jgi:hypothetical protein
MGKMGETDGFSPDFHLKTNKFRIKEPVNAWFMLDVTGWR